MILPVTVTSSCFFVAPRNSRQPHQSGVLPCHTHPAAFNPVLVRIRHKDSFLCCSFRSPVSYSCRFVGCFDGVLLLLRVSLGRLCVGRGTLVPGFWSMPVVTVVICWHRRCCSSRFHFYARNWWWGVSTKCCTYITLNLPNVALTLRLLGHHYGLQPSLRLRLPSLRQDFSAIITASSHHYDCACHHYDE
jgi:hypothetical protein